MKIMNKLTLKNLRMNKARTVVTIIGIMLSVALITVVTGMVSSVLETMIVTNIKNTGDYDISASGKFEERFIEKVKNNSDVRDLYTRQYMGLAEFSDSKASYVPFIKVFGLNKNCFESGFDLSLSEGKFPENSGELLLSQDFVKQSGKKYHAGDKITLSYGQRYYKTDKETAKKIGIENITSEPIRSSLPYSEDVEEFKKQNEKTYTIAGILNSSGGSINDMYAFSCVCVYTLADINSPAETNITSDDLINGYAETNQTIFIRFNDGTENRYKEIFADLLGTNVDYINDQYNLSEKEYEQFNSDCEKSGVRALYFSANSSLLMSKGIDINAKNLSILIALIGFVLFIIVIASVFIIRNSFDISITEKTKLYGMLSATGATPRQIKHNVYFEGIFLGMIGIPLGIFLGIGTTAVLIWICNTVLTDVLEGTNFIFKISFIGLLASLVLSAVTIFFSSMNTAKRASKIPPIEAIRSNTDIKISAKNKKKLKTPGFITKLFGAGGNIAWKNMKRNRKKYRATVISIVLSVAVYISIYSFMDYNLVYINEKFINSPYNVEVSINTVDTETGEPLSPDKLIEKYNSIASLENVDNYIYSTYMSVEMSFASNNLTDEFKNTSYSNGNVIIDDEKCIVWGNIKAVDDNNFKKIAESNGMTFEDCKDKFFIYNTVKITDSNKKKSEYLKFLKTAENTPLTLKFELYDKNKEEYITTEKNVTLAGSTKYIQTQPVTTYDDNIPIIYISMENYLKIFGNNEYLFFNMSVNSSDADKFEENLNELSNTDKSIKIDNIFNYSKILHQLNAITLILQIFVYGFIIVISLIGLTNVFNTITANMRLRRKEFAVLQSIGMTKREFNRMISLESLLYTLKSLLIGIPLGIISSILIYNIYASNLDDGLMPYIFPGLAVLISTVVVLIIVWVIMRFSIRKVRKQNIIETIRNDNI